MLNLALACFQSMLIFCFYNMSEFVCLYEGGCVSVLRLRERVCVRVKERGRVCMFVF